eukprot:1160112-Pelagomonas_calceolata.AAC.1
MEAMQNFVQKLSHSVGGNSETVRDLLGKSRVADLRKEEHGGVACLRATQTVGEALQVLGERKIMSAPVLGVGQEGTMEDVLAEMPEQQRNIMFSSANFHAGPCSWMLLLHTWEVCVPAPS